MNGPEGSVRIERETRVAAPPAAVWRAWADPAGLAAWFVDRASGPVEAGRELTWHWDAFGFEARVRVLSARAPERLVLELSDGSGEARVLEVGLMGERGGTVLQIVESGFGPDDPRVADVGSGWTIALGVLRVALEQHAGEPRREVLVLEASPAGGVPLTLYDTRAGLARWLCPDGDHVPGAGRFDGERIAASGREAVWSWPARSGALELKAFGPPGAGTFGVRMSVWGAGGGDLDPLRNALTAAVARLRSAVERET